MTLNRDDRDRPRRVIRRVDLAHPHYTFEIAWRRRRELPTLNGRRRTYFAAPTTGYGFHEDGLASGVRAAAALGAPW